MTKIITIEGTDCSGKETQAKLLYKNLKKDNILVERLGYPDYDTPTGKIVGGPYLGKKHIGEGYFAEGASNVDPKVAALYYAADRRYNANKVKSLIDDGYLVILDRYVSSNMGHQGGKIKDKDERLSMYKWLENLEYELLELQRPDITIFLHMPYKYSLELKKNRSETPDQHEMDEDHLRHAEEAYLELASLYNFKVINCVDGDRIKTPNEISLEVYNFIKNSI